MNIVDMLQLTQGGRALLEQGANLGLAKGDMVGLLGRMVPAIAAALKGQGLRQDLTPAALLKQLGGAQLADAVEADGADSLAGFADQGQAVLARLLPQDQTGSTLASRLAAASNLEPGPVQALLPSVTGLFTGVLQQVETGSFKPKGGGMAAMAVTMAANMLVSSGSGASGLLKFIDLDGAQGLIKDLQD
jgi:hypothetical protein